MIFEKLLHQRVFIFRWGSPGQMINIRCNPPGRFVIGFPPVTEIFNARSANQHTRCHRHASAERDRPAHSDAYSNALTHQRADRRPPYGHLNAHADAHTDD